MGTDGYLISSKYRKVKSDNPLEAIKAACKSSAAPNEEREANDSYPLGFGGRGEQREENVRSSRWPKENAQPRRAGRGRLCVCDGRCWALRAVHSNIALRPGLFGLMKYKSMYSTGL